MSNVNNPSMDLLNEILKSHTIPKENELISTVEDKNVEKKSEGYVEPTQKTSMKDKAFIENNNIYPFFGLEEDSSTRMIIEGKSTFPKCF